MQTDNHIFQGLKRGNHQIKQQAEFLWEAHNIRLTNREDNTALSITNERGPKRTANTLQGNYVGHCIVGKFLVVFTADDSFSYIYRIEKNGIGYKQVLLFKSVNRNNRPWTPNNPIEAIGIYETELVQKVYWIDGVNQPRIINITKPELKEVYSADINDYTQYYKLEEFNFVRDINLNARVNIDKIYGDGEFPSGVVQYAFTYYNKYAQETKIWYTTPLYYTSFIDRAGSGEEKVSNSFKITITNPDRSFEYIRVYSIIRTSISREPTIKRVRDIPIDSTSSSEEDKVSFIDTGTIGDIVDTTELMFLGGTSLIAECITHKDGTLFLGNITLKEGEYYKEIREVLEKCELIDTEVPVNTSKDVESGVYYDYTPDLSGPNTARFKTNETYRLGIQAQFKDGSWSNPVWMADEKVSVIYPWDEHSKKDNTNQIRTTKAIRVTREQANKLYNDYGVRKLRTCVVFPATHERDILFQGILNPTVYSVMHRKTNAPYAMSSWFFRPIYSTALLALDKLKNSIDTDVYSGAYIQCRHNKPLFTGNTTGAEIQNMIPSDIKGPNDITDVTADKYGSYFFVDENIVTMHSPDVEFDTSAYHLDYNNAELNIIGMAKLGAISGDIDITSSTQAGDSLGFVHNYIGYKTGTNTKINGGLVMGNFFSDNAIKKDKSKDVSKGKMYSLGTERYWPVYPWHRNGSLNNDEVRPVDEGQRTSVLIKKTISNLKFFTDNISINSLKYTLRDTQLFSSNEIELTKLRPSYLDRDISYLGNMETVVITDEDYNFYSSNSFRNRGEEISDDKYITETKEAVSMKYKSTPHIVFSLGTEKGKLEILPRNKSVFPTSYVDKYISPEWMDTESNLRKKYDGILMNCGFSFSDYKKYGDNGMFFITEDYKLGKYIESGGEPKMVELSKEEGEGLILRICKDILVVFDGKPTDWRDFKFPTNTSREDYREGTEKEREKYSIPNEYKSKYLWYAGEDKFYEVGYTNDGKVELTEITNNIISESEIIKTPIEQNTFSKSINNPYLLIGELTRNVDKTTKFGGDTDEAKRINLWIPSCEPEVIGTSDVIVPYVWGDTWYARYDCLKTYPFTKEDQNQIVEIGSFMCETRVNIDGRCDKNRGQMSNIDMSPINFNLLNEIYSQKDNYFHYSILDDDYYKNDKFSHQVIWSTEKFAGSDIDPWTHISTATPLDMDGSKGAVTKLGVFNEALLCWQQRAFSMINFNSRVQIPTSDGVSIEISNGGKVDGYRFISDDVGVQNKWSVCNSGRGVYFIDDNTDTLWMFNGQLTNACETLGMSWWFKKNHSTNSWIPVHQNNNGIRTFYDSAYNDIYFVPGREEEKIFNIEDNSTITVDKSRDAICYSEPLGQFVSELSYGGTQAMFQFGDKFISLRNNEDTVSLWENFEGEYNKFFNDDYKPWDLSFISNESSLYTKIFDTIELRADRYISDKGFNEGTPSGDIYSQSVQEGQPIDFIRVSNEYQDTGEVKIDSRNLRKKFRIWRGLIPRNKDTRQRIRNPWSMIKIGCLKPDNTKTIIHDVSVRYTV